MTRRDPATGLTDAEVARLADEAYAQRNDPDAWESEERPEVAGDVRLVVSVRFNRGELGPIERAAAAAGLPLSTFIRSAAINAVSPVDVAALRTQLDALQANLNALNAAVGRPEPAKRRRRAA